MSSVRWAFCTSKWNPTRSVGRLLMRKVLSESFVLSNSEIKLGRTGNGKPYVINAKDNFYFNVSHQGDYVVLAGEKHCNVGVDIMKTELKGNQTLDEFFHSMRRQFSCNEWQTIQDRSSEEEKLEMFMRYWCLKESYVKALGVGLGLLKKLRTIDFHIDKEFPRLAIQTVTKNTKLFLNDSLSEEWCFEESKLDENHLVAVALQRNDVSFKKNENNIFQFLTMNDLTSSLSPLMTVEESLWSKFAAKINS
ncbi:L-aminoadipate-semialdehyde dehydrogenase-phosphopantetheinyl transferase-like isoform X2 [Xenia sp. Carnegie-2017]|uniref:L-aminoadipate-semialdehyde dehydrogenase-phosphopantetheinyl transferase-like isoform X2 n=1 Tax=Xenia sp. Carnegie-2017 TaxID=2897299 RepID=UPI001F042943|nr:L-aminoadipate-semialdehyde dehydrogenase-phosphopantetheinyl transferase-like isoform X2 [Xenia sp. Carnegie-2017]